MRVFYYLMHDNIDDAIQSQSISKSKIKLLNLAAKLFYKIFMTPSNLDISLTNADIKNIIEFTESFPLFTLDDAIDIVEMARSR